MNDNPTAHAKIAFDASLFSADAVKRALYRYLDVFAAEITAADKVWACTLTFHKPHSAAEIERHLNNLRIEVLDHDLRTAIANETAAIRNTVLALAFSRTGLGDRE